MDAETAARIRERSAWEAERDAYPPGFPTLPAVPAARYVDPAFFELEREHVFGTVWLLAALEDDLLEPGDVLGVDHLPVGIFLARGRDGRVRAFRNTCSHRGAQLVPAGPGHVAKNIVCPYHAWSYDLEGELRTVPEGRDFLELDASCRGLRAVRCETFAGLVFVSLASEGPSLESWLGPVHTELAGEIGAEGSPLRLVRRVTTDVPCNWKVAADANLETYHVNALHKDTAANVLDLRTTTIELFRNGHSRMLAMGRPAAVDAPRPPLPEFANLNALAGEGVLNFGFFPNIALVVSPQLAFTVNAWPISATETRYETWYMAPEPESDETKALWDGIIGFNSAVIDEDISMLGGMQRSLNSGSIEEMPLSYQERRIYHIHEEIDRCIGAERVPAELRVEPVLEKARGGGGDGDQ